MSFNFQKLDSESAEAVHFETVLNALSKANGRTFRDTAIVLSRAMNSFRDEHPYRGMEFKLYNYSPSTGFHVEEISAKRHSFFLNEIAKGHDYNEDPNPNNAGTYYLIDEYGHEYTSCYSFYFKLSELLRFLIQNKVAIPPEFNHAMPDAEKSHAFYQKLIDKSIARFMEEIEGSDEESSTPTECAEAKWDNFAGKDTALKLIAGMAIALEKTKGKYVRGGKLNKSEISRTVKKLIDEYGHGVDVTDKALIMLIDEALRSYAPKISA